MHLPDDRSEFSRTAAATLPKNEEQCLARRPAYPHDDQVVVAEAGLPQDRVLRRDIQSQRSSDRAAIFVAVFFGSTLAVASSFASALAAAYFLYPPKLSFYIADPTHASELGFILLLSV